MIEDENPGLIYEPEDGPDPLNCSYTPIVLIHDGGGTCFSCMQIAETHPQNNLDSVQQLGYASRMYHKKLMML